VSAWGRILSLLVICGFIKRQRRAERHSDSPAVCATQQPSRTPHSESSAQWLYGVIAVASTFLLIWLFLLQGRAVDAASPVAPRGSVYFSTLGADAPLDLDCAIVLSEQSGQQWNCTAGISWDKKERAEESATVVAYAVDSNASVTLGEASRRLDGLQVASGTGSYSFGFGPGIRPHSYSAAVMRVPDVSKCGGFVIRDSRLQETEGLPFPSPCTFTFTLAAPKSATGFGMNQVTSLSPAVNSVYQGASEDDTTSVGAFEIAKELNVLPSTDETSAFWSAAVHRQLRAHLDSTPPGWVPTTIIPAPTADSPNYLHPAWVSEGSSKTNFQFFVSGTVPNSSAYWTMLLWVTLTAVVASAAVSAAFALLNETFQRRGAQ